MATTKKATPAQIAARKLFAQRAKAGTLKKAPRKTTRKANPSEWALTRGKDSNYSVERLEPTQKTYFFASEAGAIREAKAESKLDCVGSVYKLGKRGKKPELIYWYDSTGVYPAGSYGQAHTRLPNPVSSITRAKKRLGAPAKKTTLENAVIALHKLIKSGWEYPDAEYKISGKYGVTGSSLRRMYDAHFVNTNPIASRKTVNALVGGIHYAVLFYDGKKTATGKPDIVFPARDHAHAKAFAQNLADKGASGLIIIEKTRSKV